MLVSPVQGVGPGEALGLASQPAALSGEFQASETVSGKKGDSA